jgi:hypothetical protein
MGGGSGWHSSAWSQLCSELLEFLGGKYISTGDSSVKRESVIDNQELWTDG